MTIDKRIGVIGAGKMGTALVSGMLKAGVVKKSKICAGDISEQRCEYVSKMYGVTCFSDNSLVIANSDIVIIAVEPKHIKGVLEEISGELENQTLVSIAAGVTIDFLKENLKKPVPIIRAMPNNPCMVGEGMIVLTSSPEASERDLDTVKEIFTSIGRVLVLEEHLFDAVTGLSGSGPAYIYMVIEGLTEGGIKAGLPEDKAVTLAAQTVLGAGKMVLETDISPDKLREMVTTPGGTTVEGLKELKRGKVKSFFCRAVRKATQRSRELLKT